MTTNTINTFALKTDLPPDIPGLTFRGFQGESDYKIIHQIRNASLQADQIEEEYSLEEITRQYNNIQRCNLYTEMIFAEIEGKPVGYGRCWWNQEADGDYIYPSLIHLVPDWRRKGIGLALLQHLHARIKEISHQHPPEAPKFHQMWTADTEQWLNAVITHLGLEPIRYSVLMTRPCSLPIEINPLPKGLEVRDVKTDELRKVWDGFNEAFLDHFGMYLPTEEQYQNWVSDPEFQPHLWKIAWEGDQLVGTELNYISYSENEKYNRKRGYTEYISVRRPWRRKGVARALLSRSIKMFQEMGMEETCLGVDTENPNGALKLYQSLGYKEEKRYTNYRAEIT